MKVAYLTNCFGSQSHTFMRREIRALRELGLALSLYGVRKDRENTASDASDLVGETSYLYPLNPGETIRENLRYFLKNPARYVRGLGRAAVSPELSLKRRAKMVYHYLVSANHATRMRREGVTHIHAHFLNVSASVAMYASWHSQIPYSITVHSAGTYGTDHILGVEQKLSEAQFLVMISHNNVNYFDAISPCRERSHVVRCGMQLDDFSLRSARDASELSGEARLVAVGRFVEKKGFAHLIEAARLLRERGRAFQLTLIGDGPLLEELKQRARDGGLDECVHFAGRQGSSEVRRAMAAADVVIVPSVTSRSGEKEGLPVVIMEAMATGVPVVASDHSGIPEIVRPGETGWLTPEKDPSAIRDAILEVLDGNHDALVRRARHVVESEFNIDRVAEQRKALFLRYHRE